MDTKEKEMHIESVFVRARLMGSYHFGPFLKCLEEREKEMREN
jgi:hypothetical protein